MLIRTIAAVASLAAVAGCVTPPQHHDISNSRTYAKTYDATWEGIVTALATRNIQIKNIAKDSGVVYAEATRFDDSMADCGKPGLFRIVGRRVTFNVLVNHVGEKQLVTVNSEFTEARRFENNFQTVTCNSRGAIEGMILNSI